MIEFFQRALEERRHESLREAELALVPFRLGDDRLLLGVRLVVLPRELRDGVPASFFAASAASLEAMACSSSVVALSAAMRISSTSLMSL